MSDYKTYYVEYVSKDGQYKVYRNKKTNCIVEFKNYNLALSIRNWFQAKPWCETAEIKEIYY